MTPLCRESAGTSDTAGCATQVPLRNLRMRQLFVGALCALSLVGACAQAIVTPNANLLAEGIPPIPQTIADKVA